MNSETESKTGELNMTVSPICQKEGKKVAYVSFTDGIRTIEGRIPDCKLLHNDGFTEEESEQIVAYMKRELTTLKKMASRVNVMDAFLRK